MASFRTACYKVKPRMGLPRKHSEGGVPNKRPRVSIQTQADNPDAGGYLESTSRTRRILNSSRNSTLR